MPTNKQRRQAAQRHLQRQLERRAELARKRRRNLGILATVLAVVIVGGAALLIICQAAPSNQRIDSAPLCVANRAT